MLYLIAKLLIAPTGLITLALLASVSLHRYPKLAFSALGFALAILLVAGNFWVAGKLVKSLEWKHLPPDELPTADAIVVLSGQIHPREYPRRTVEIGANGDRLLYGGWLYKQQKAPRIIVTGAGRFKNSANDTAASEDMATILKMVGIPPDVIKIESEAQNTYQHTVYCQEIFEAHGIKSILLVTSAIHMPRALAVFNRLDITVTPAPTDFFYTLPPVPGPWYRKIWYVIPTWKGLGATTDALHEYLGMFYYRTKGWL